VRVEGLRVTGRFSTLVDPERPIPPHITGITGIDDSMVRGQPIIDDALPRFIEFAREDVLVAHNAPFDLRFLNYERLRLRDGYFTQPWLDTLVLARQLLNGVVPRHDLATLARWAGASVQPSHRALADAEATAHVLVALISRLADGAQTTLDLAMSIGQPGGRRRARGGGEAAAAA
jgi:DNA polymerase-3 subunit epsilon